MLGSYALGSRPLSTPPRLPRAFRVSALQGEYGWAAWSYSRQAKLNTWAWHGLGPLGNVNSWATLGNALYLRGENDTLVYVMQPDAFFNPGETNTESTSVEATTQWLDFGKPGQMKALTGVDIDCQNITAVEVYLSVDGDRAGVLSETVPVGSNQGGWTYSGEVIPLASAGTEFKLKFIGDSDKEAQINRITVYWDPVAG